MQCSAPRASSSSPARGFRIRGDLLAREVLKPEACRASHPFSLPQARGRVPARLEAGARGAPDRVARPSPLPLRAGRHGGAAGRGWGRSPGAASAAVAAGTAGAPGRPAPAVPGLQAALPAAAAAALLRAVLGLRLLHRGAGRGAGPPLRSPGDPHRRRGVGDVRWLRAGPDVPGERARGGEGAPGSWFWVQRGSELTGARIESGSRIQSDLAPGGRPGIPGRLLALSFLSFVTWIFLGLRFPLLKQEGQLNNVISLRDWGLLCPGHPRVTAPSAPSQEPRPCPGTRVRRCLPHSSVPRRELGVLV